MNTVIAHLFLFELFLLTACFSSEAGELQSSAVVSNVQKIIDIHAIIDDKAGSMDVTFVNADGTLFGTAHDQNKVDAITAELADQGVMVRSMNVVRPDGSSLNHLMTSLPVGQSKELETESSASALNAASWGRIHPDFPLIPVAFALAGIAAVALYVLNQQVVTRGPSSCSWDNTIGGCVCKCQVTGWSANKTCGAPDKRSCNVNTCSNACDDL